MIGDAVERMPRQGEGVDDRDAQRADGVSAPTGGTKGERRLSVSLSLDPVESEASASTEPGGKAVLQEK